MKRFKKIYIEITNVCNLNCRFCPPTKREKTFMNIDNFIKIINQVKEYTDYVYFHLKGEPLLNPNIDKFIDICYENKIDVNITTNATLISKRKEELTNKKGLRQINYSLHSFKENNIEDVERYMNDVFSFIENNPNIIHSLRFWNLQDGINSNYKVLKMVMDYFNIDEELFKNKSFKVRDKIYINQDNEFTWPDKCNNYYEVKGFCYGLRDQIGILVNGDVVPCCLDSDGEVILGNIFEKSLMEIINSYRAKNIYDGFSNRIAVEQLCIHCEFKNRF